ncbi:MAG: hypothetical protein U0W40_12035 [Acidimicrobiia bacterium]
MVAIGLSLTPALAGTRPTGIQTDLAIPLDELHVLAMAVWLSAAWWCSSLRGRCWRIRRRCGCVAAVVHHASGAGRAGGHGHLPVGVRSAASTLRNTDSGRLLIAVIARGAGGRRLCATS